jgi:ABC-2 type transport system ATP-binding protein
MTAGAPVPTDAAQGPRTRDARAEATESDWTTGRGGIIELEEASVRFGDLDAIRNITLSVPKGTILGVIGPSGAGKTTTIRVLTGGLLPTSGRVRVMGEDPRRFHRRTRERIGYMPQLFTLYPDLTAGENVDFVASLFGLLWFRRRRRVREVLKVVDLWDARGRRASDLSGGMQRRLELASALVHEPELLFLDEPTAGIDPLLRARVWQELHRLREAGRTLLVTTQYVNEAEECDQVALIAQGRLAALATPDELRREATGGDVVEIETAAAFDGPSLEEMPQVRRVIQLGPRSLRVVVDDAGTGTADVVAEIGRRGGSVASAREYRLSFDEIFAELVERNRRRLEAGEEAADRHDGNEAEARQLVEDELEQRQRDAASTPIDERVAARGIVDRPPDDQPAERTAAVEGGADEPTDVERADGNQEGPR